MDRRRAFAEGLFEKALLKIKDRDFKRATGLLAEAIKICPDLGEAWVVRGNVRMSEGEYLDALLHFDRALEVEPEKWDAWNNRGLAFSNLGMWEAAIDAFSKSLAYNPSPDPHLNLGNLYCHLMQLTDAENEYRAALEYFQDNLHIHINLGLALLGQGKWKEGWEHYEARHANSPYQMRSRRKYPPWRGEPLEGKTILLYPEQGLGDEVLFARFATRMKGYGAGRVILEAMPALVRLHRTLDGVDEVVIKGDTLPDGIYYSCAIMDVPMMLGMGPKDVPCPQSYLSAERRNWRLPKGFNVGLCWQTGQRPLQPSAAATAANKSIPLEWLCDLARRPGVNLVSLQQNNPDPQLSADFGIIDRMCEIGDLADTASLIDELDLVISVDTVVAHVAAALGKPTWNMVRHAGYWPWLLPELEHSWYPSMRLYRQPTTGDWDTPIKQMVADYLALVSERMKEAA